MKHEVFGKHLSRNKNQRTALFKSLVRSLILYETIQTTEAKAKAIKGLVDKIINQAKNPVSRKLVSRFLDKATLDKLTQDLTRFKGRNSGYTSLVKLGKRLGDAATIVEMSLLLEETKSTPVKKAASNANKKIQKVKAGQK